MFTSRTLALAYRRAVESLSWPLGSASRISLNRFSTNLMRTGLLAKHDQELLAKLIHADVGGLDSGAS